jgi:hypothetical protein
MRRWLPFVLLCAAAPVSSRGGIIYAAGAWAAIDRGATSEALARSSRIAANGKVQARAGFTFSADRRRWGEFHARLRRMPRPRTSIMLKAAGQPFLLVARGDWAWSSGPMQEQAIMAAVRGGGWMSIEARDTAGRRFTDYYALDGAATAIDAAAARCAGKSQPR